MYPTIPNPAVTFPIKGAVKELPRQPGIYFVWEDDQLIYVGQTHHLYNRVRRDRYSWLKPGHHQISWVLVPAEELLSAESHYINIGQPSRNIIYPNTQVRVRPGANGRWHVYVGKKRKISYPDFETATRMADRILGSRADKMRTPPPRF